MEVGIPKACWKDCYKESSVWCRELINICSDNTLRKWHWSLHQSKLGLFWEKWRVLTPIRGVWQSLQPHLTVLFFGYICLYDCFLGEIWESHYSNHANKFLIVKQWQVNEKWKTQCKHWRLGAGSLLVTDVVPEKDWGSRWLKPA